MRGARARGVGYLQLTLHSSELMPGGSPSFPTAAAIERLYGNLEIIFEELSAWCTGMTLSEFHARMIAPAPAPARTPITVRSEERRVGKECRSRWSPYH